MNRTLVQAFVMLVAMFGLAKLVMPVVDHQEKSAERPAAADDSKGKAAGFTGDEIVIERDSSGQFHLMAAINGQDTDFLVDTGADTIALTLEDAERIGLDIDPQDFRPIAETASGTGYGTEVNLETVELGGTRIDGSRAIVVKGLGVNLLGQSVLREFGKVELRGDTMVIQHN